MSFHKVLLIAICGAQFLWDIANGFTKLEPEVFMDPYQLIVTKGYPCQEHKVTTEDGYRLTLFRIPPPIGDNEKNDNGDQSTPRSSQSPVVFLQHGLLASCTNWISNMRNQSLAFLLADAGFDVWLGNFRGNTYSRHHESLLPFQREFWDFSWSDMAKYDLPVMIENALIISNASQLFYVGHSQGTLAAFTAFSTNKTLAAKIKHFFALAPVATVGHISGALRFYSDFHRVLEWLLDSFGELEFLPSTVQTQFAARVTCGLLPNNLLCQNVLFLIGGHESTQMNFSRIPVYLGHNPAGTSVKNMAHFAQMVKSQRCCDYDYGCPEKNMKHYNQSHPPDYPIHKLSVPTTAFWSSEDVLADRIDVAMLLLRVPSIAKSVELKGFNHLDFIWGLRAADEIYKPIIRTIKEMI